MKKNFSGLLIALALICCFVFTGCSTKQSSFCQLANYCKSNYETSSQDNENTSYLLSIKKDSSFSINIEYFDNSTPYFSISYLSVTSDLSYGLYLYFNIYNYNQYIEYDFFGEIFNEDQQTIMNFKVFPEDFNFSNSITNFEQYSGSSEAGDLARVSLATTTLLSYFNDFLSAHLSLSAANFGFSQLGGI